MARLPLAHHPTRALRHRLSEERGQSMVEFSMVLVAFVIIVLGILYFARYMNYANQETNIAEQGVRWAAVNTNPGSSSGQTLLQYIAAQASGELSTGSGDVTKGLQAWIYNPTGQTSSVRVCVAATVQFPTPLGEPSTTIAEWATMHIEQTNTVWTSSTTNLPSQCPTS